MQQSQLLDLAVDVPHPGRRAFRLARQRAAHHAVAREVFLQAVGDEAALQQRQPENVVVAPRLGHADGARLGGVRSEEHTSELQSLMRISYAVFCLKKKNKTAERKKEENTATP